MSKLLPFPLVACAFLLSGFISQVLAADVSGVWKSEFDSQIGHQIYTFAFKQDGSKLTGKANSEAGDRKREAELKEGKVEGENEGIQKNLVGGGGLERRVVDYSPSLRGRPLPCANLPNRGWRHPLFPRLGLLRPEHPRHRLVTVNPNPLLTTLPCLDQGNSD